DEKRAPLRPGGPRDDDVAQQVLDRHRTDESLVPTRRLDELLCGIRVAAAPPRDDLRGELPVRGGHRGVARRVPQRSDGEIRPRTVVDVTAERIREGASLLLR